MVEELDLAGLDKPSGRSLIVDPVSNLGFNLRDGAEMVDYILAQSACRPVIIQLYCRELVNRARYLDLNEIGIEDVKQVEQTRAFREDMLDAFLIDMPSLSRLIVLFMLENDTFTEESLHEAIRREGVNCELGKIIDAVYLLEDPGIIERRDKFLHFAYPAFPRLIRELHDISYFKSETLKELSHG